MKRTLMAVLALGASLLISGLASAQTADFLVGPKLTTPDSTATGWWHVVATKSGASDWDLTINAGAPVPNGDVVTIQVGFADSLGAGIDVDSATSTGGTSVNWTTAGVDYGYLTFSVKGADLTPGAGPNDTFTANVHLAGAAPVASVSAILTGRDNKKVWEADAPVPDPSTMALSLVGLAPLGLLLRKRTR
ncbi:MAG TPA: hypothetical protein VGN26_05415 [Armatimonadota bacterium]